MDKDNKLQQILEKSGTAAVAFSGGVDSTFLLARAVDILGRTNVLAVTSDSYFFPQRELESAKMTAAMLKAEHVIVAVDILEADKVAQNTRQRCYYCKRQMFSRIRALAGERGFRCLLHGVNTDDLSSFRPGLKAAGELGFLSPLADAGFSKKDIRQAAFEMGIAVWDKPSQSCLATRIPYGTKIIPEDLRMVDQAERALQALGFEQVRVRLRKDGSACIEVMPEQVNTILKQEVQIRAEKELTEIGLKSVTIDENGYQTGK